MSFAVVLKKECLDNCRDRRTILSSFSLAILGPIFFVGIMVFVLERALGEADEPIKFAVVGSEHAPQLMQPSPFYLGAVTIFVDKGAGQYTPTLRLTCQNLRYYWRAC